MSNRDPRLYLDDILVSCRKVQRFIEGLDQERFLNDDLVIDAVIRNLEIIGEAANRLPEKLREQYKETPWQEMIGFRNIAAHGYFHVDLNIVWEIAHKRLQELVHQVEKILAELEGDAYQAP